MPALRGLNLADATVDRRTDLRGDGATLHQFGKHNTHSRDGRGFGAQDGGSE